MREGETCALHLPLNGSKMSDDGKRKRGGKGKRPEENSLTQIFGGHITGLSCTQCLTLAARSVPYLPTAGISALLYPLFFTSSGQGASASSSFSASPPGSSTTTSSASLPTRTVYREAGQNASLACGGVNANTLVRRLEWLCRGCRSASPSHETTIASFKGGAQIHRAWLVWFSEKLQNRLL